MLFQIVAQSAPPPITHPTDLLHYYEIASRTWGPLVKTAAEALLISTATIDLAYSGYEVGLKQGQGIDAVISMLVQRVMTIGFWLAIIAGTLSLNTIVDSFIQLGLKAAGLHIGKGENGITPSAIAADGASVVGALFKKGDSAGWFEHFVIGTVLALCGIIILTAFGVLVFHYIKFQVQTYFAIGAAFIFTGFAGSRWTSPYAERYITLVISAGFRLFAFFLMVGLGHSLVQTWFLPDAHHLLATTDELISAGMIAVMACTYAALCWTLPTSAADMLSGALTLNGHHLMQPMIAGLQSMIAGTTMIVNASTGGSAAPATTAASTFAMAGFSAGNRSPSSSPASNGTRKGAPQPPQPSATASP